MMGGLLILGWLVGALFVAIIGGRAQGIGGFFGWGVTSLLVSPFLALLALVVVMQREQLDWLKEIREGLARGGGGAGPTERGGPSRFGGLAGE